MIDNNVPSFIQTDNSDFSLNLEFLNLMQKNRDKIANLFQGRYNFVTFQGSNSFQKNIIQLKLLY